MSKNHVTSEHNIYISHECILVPVLSESQLATEDFNEISHFGGFIKV